MNLHLDDNSAINEDDKLFKVRPYIELLNKKFQQFVVNKTNLLIDEQMIPYRGHHSARMFCKGKPISQVGPRLCGYTRPSDVVIYAGNYETALVLFVSDASVGREGFTIDIQFGSGAARALAMFPLLAFVLQALLQYDCIL